MASAEQPPKKRKHYDTLPESPPPPPPPPPETAPEVIPPPPPRSPQTLPHPPTPPPPPSHDEILAKRRSKDEVRSVLDCFRRIKLYLSKKDPFMHDLEQSYLALITASRGLGFSEVRRLVK